MVPVKFDLAIALMDGPAEFAQNGLIPVVVRIEPGVAEPIAVGILVSIGNRPIIVKPFRIDLGVTGFPLPRFERSKG